MQIFYINSDYFNHIVSTIKVEQQTWGNIIMPSTIITSPVLGPLGPGEYESWDVILKGQRVYNIFVYAHEPGVDFDLYVFDENMNLIDVDQEIDSSAYCRTEPNWTGPFRITIECVRGFSTYQLAIEELQPTRKRILGLF